MSWQGDLSSALENYSLALQTLPIKDPTEEMKQLSVVILSNRAMCHLKQYDLQSSGQSKDVEVLNACIQDCTTGLQHLQSTKEANHNTKSKLLYRRAKAFFLSTDHTTDTDDKLNSSAQDLLSLLSFDACNTDAAELLRTIQKRYGGKRSNIVKALDYLRTGKSSGDREITPLNCLRMMQASLADDTVSCAEEIGKNDGVPLLLSIARGIHDVSESTCRIASLHILSACCSHDAFIIKYALRDTLSPAVLAQIVEEAKSSDVIIATMALLIRLIVHWDHREVMRFFSAKIAEDGTILDSKSVPQVLEVDGSSVCRVAVAALLWHDKEGNETTSTPRAALDLLSAWMASDLDALDAASDACFDSSPSTSSKYKRASYAKLTSDEIRQMKPRQVAAHRKREAEYREANLQRALRHINMFCHSETGGLDAMLAVCATTNDPRLRREVGLQIGRMMSRLQDDDDVKKLVAAALGCRDWRSDNIDGVQNLTIEELDESKDEGCCEAKEQQLFSIMKRGQMTSSLLVGKPEIGTWALKHGWSNGNGVEELKHLIDSDDSRAMSVASELVSEAASVESARPLLAKLVEEGTLDDLLAHPDADVRSGAASCAAKIGLASKALSGDEGDVMELLDVAIELLFDEDGLDSSIVKNKTKELSKVPGVNSTTETTSMDRGIEVVSYLVQKTFVKNKVASGYVPKESPPNRKTAIQRLVEIACLPNSGDAQMAYGLAGIFNLLSVSIETLQKEAFVGKEITKEQYDQLQALGKTKEEKEVDFEMGKRDGDSPIAVTDRIQKLANANVPRALVKLLDGSNTDTTQQKLLEGMGRMASEPSVRGIMIQQGCLSACLELDKGVRNSVLPSSHLIDYLANCHIYVYSGQTKRIRKEHIEACEELCCQTTDYYQPKHFDSIPTIWIHRPLDQTRQRQ
jgi:hypothetical protein